MIKFMSKSLVSLAIVGALWSPTESWLDLQRSAGLSCRADFSVCEVAGKVIPLVDRSTVLGQIAAQARRDPARQFGQEARAVAMTALNGVRAAALKDE
jgi:hypothetical protein